ncbi:MAG: dTDP-4-dehydrorhamnose reductase [Thermodesulfobacteriota bacterium]
MKILLTGDRGLLGRDCFEVLHRDHEVLALDRGELDISDPAQVDATVAAFRPRALVNCAAYTQVDRAETERDEAFRGNVTGPRTLAASAARHRALLVHISTDYIFDGHKPPPTPYLEDDPPNPLSWYGYTKLEGERAVQGAGTRHLIVRTSWMYGRHGANFLTKILQLALSPQIPELKVVADQFGAPTWSYRLALQLARLLDAGSEGIYHASGEGYCTWFELARHFLGRLGVDKPLQPCSSRDFPTPAARPPNSILENHRLQAAGLSLMRPWQEDVDEFVAAWGEDLLREAKVAVG